MRVLTHPLASQVASIAAAHGPQAAVEDLAEKIDGELSRPSKEVQRILRVLCDREAAMPDGVERELLRGRLTGLMEAFAIFENCNPPMPVQKGTKWPLHFPTDGRVGAFFARDCTEATRGSASSATIAAPMENDPPEHEPAIQDEEMRMVLDAADRGDVVIVTVHDWAYCGIAEFHLANGWKLAVFDDCDEWDYIEWVEAPDGRRESFVVDAPGHATTFTKSDVLKNWSPKHSERWGTDCPTP